MWCINLVFCCLGYAFGLPCTRVLVCCEFLVFTIYLGVCHLLVSYSGVQFPACRLDF